MRSICKSIALGYGNTAGYALNIVGYFGNKSTMRLIASNCIVPSTTLVDASESDRRMMSGLLVKSGYKPIAVEPMEATKEEVE